MFTQETAHGSVLVRFKFIQLCHDNVLEKVTCQPSEAPMPGSCPKSVALLGFGWESWAG